MDAFLNTLWEYYGQHSRNLPWRVPEPDGHFDPYKILVSELMLQQTQVPRVVPKYQAFLKKFPNVKALAAASLADVLKLWSGLGYNRRAKYLWEAAKQVKTVKTFPNDMDSLTALPGVGANTAGAILAYAFNLPVVFIETNVRTVFIHHFFNEEEQVSDTQISELLQEALVQMGHDPRDFYWALMDYGSYLKTMVANPNRRSKHYAKQSAFEGSRRQVRGQVLRILGDKPSTKQQLSQQITDERLNEVLVELINEKLITQHLRTYQLYAL